MTAIGQATAFPSSMGPSRTGLEAQLARYKKEQSACVNCASSSTAEGKRQIQDLDRKISVTESKLQQVEQAPSPLEVTRSVSAPAATSGAGQSGALVDTYA
jgi:phage shock protein A